MYILYCISRERRIFRNRFIKGVFYYNALVLTMFLEIFLEKIGKDFLKKLFFHTYIYVTLLASTY